MIWQIVKRDSAWRAALILALVAAIGAPLAPHGMLAALFCWPGLFLLQLQPQRRATPFQTGLPIHAKDLFLGRVTALLALLWLPASAGAAMLMAIARPSDAVLLLEAAAGLSIVVFLAQSSRPSQTDGARWLPFVWWTLFCAAAYPVERFGPKAIVFPACALVCALLFWNIWRRLPSTFEVLPTKLVQQTTDTGVSLVRTPVWWPVLRALYPPRLLLLLPALLLQMHSNQWMFALAMCMIPIISALGQMGWLRGLPLGRRTLMAAVLLPWGVPMVLGVLFSGFVAPQSVQINLDRLDGGEPYSVRPPLEYWHLAPQGAAPRIEAPWGETWQPGVVHLLGLSLYNPFSMGPVNSHRFFEWQYQRASEAIYGERVTFSSMQRLETLHPLTRQARFIVLNTAASACALLLLFNIVLVGSHWRFPITSFKSSQVLGIGYAIPVFGALALDAMIRGPLTPNGSTSLLHALLLRAGALLPAGLPVVVGAAAIPVVVLLATAALLFRGFEPANAPAQPAA